MKKLVTVGFLMLAYGAFAEDAAHEAKPADKAAKKGDDKGKKEEGKKEEAKK